MNAVVIMFIDDHKGRFGVEPICNVLTEHCCRIAPQTYHAFKTRPVSARAKRDAELVVLIRDVFSIPADGPRDQWRAEGLAAQRDGVDVARHCRAPLAL